ncbi:hypothetical protein [Aeromonas phage Asp37]|nr:hypothetical protein [Aeromonas phage Asp37]
MAIPPPPKKVDRNLKALSLASLADAPAKAITAREDSALTPLNFKVSPEFRRRLKLYCVENDLTMVEFMMDTLNRAMENS